MIKTTMCREQTWKYRENKLEANFCWTQKQNSIQKNRKLDKIIEITTNVSRDTTSGTKSKHRVESIGSLKLV